MGEFEKENCAPTFSRETANQHYTSNYSTEKTTDLKDIHWYPKINIKPEDPSFKPFDMTQIRPKDVTNVQKHASQVPV